jgi:hypothetical protein
MSDTFRAISTAERGVDQCPGSYRHRWIKNSICLRISQRHHLIYRALRPIRRQPQDRLQMDRSLSGRRPSWIGRPVSSELPAVVPVHDLLMRYFFPSSYLGIVQSIQLEYGRTPWIDQPYGRGHHNFVHSSWMAGSGIKPGIVYGQSE